MARTTHFIVNDTYLKNEKVSTTVVFWVVPKTFEDEECNYNLCPGEKEVYIYHKLKAGFLKNNCKGCYGISGVPRPCVDEIFLLVKKLYPDYEFYGNKNYFKNKYRRKKCVDVEERCQKEKSPVRK